MGRSYSQARAILDPPDTCDLRYSLMGGAYSLYVQCKGTAVVLVGLSPQPSTGSAPFDLNKWNGGSAQARLLAAKALTGERSPLLGKSCDEVTLMLGAPDQRWLGYDFHVVARAFIVLFQNDRVVDAGIEED